MEVLLLWFVNCKHYLTLNLMCVQSKQRNENARAGFADNVDALGLVEYPGRRYLRGL